MNCQTHPTGLRQDVVTWNSSAVLAHSLASHFLNWQINNLPTWCVVSIVLYLEIQRTTIQGNPIWSFNTPNSVLDLGWCFRKCLKTNSGSTHYNGRDHWYRSWFGFQSSPKFCGNRLQCYDLTPILDSSPLRFSIYFYMLPASYFVLIHFILLNSYVLLAFVLGSLHCCYGIQINPAEIILQDVWLPVPYWGTQGCAQRKEGFPQKKI